MFTKRTAIVSFGLLVVLTLVVPTVGAVDPAVGVIDSHNFDHTWNDTGFNTRSFENQTAQWNMPRADQYRMTLNAWLVQNSPIAWNDAGLNTRLSQNETTGWSDVAVSVARLENHVSGWNDAGAGVA